MTETKKSNKKVIIGVIALVAVIALLAVLYFVFREKPVEGAKAITIEVIDDQAQSKVYEVNTDAEYLRQAMEEAEGLEFTGYVGDFGFTVETINGVTAYMDGGTAYWSFYVNDDYCMYGIDSQPVEDGDAFVIKFEVYVAE